MSIPEYIHDPYGDDAMLRRNCLPGWARSITAIHYSCVVRYPLHTRLTMYFSARHYSALIRVYSETFGQSVPQEVLKGAAES